MSLYDYIEKLFEQTKNLNNRLSKVEIELKELKKLGRKKKNENKLKEKKG